MKIGTWQETANEPVQEFFHVQGKDKPLSTDNQSVSKGFWFLKRSYNQEYDFGVKPLPLRSCLLHNKADAERLIYIKTKPKWITDLLQTNFSRDTGEILSQEVYRTDDLTQGNNRKIKAVNRFCSHFKPLYEKRKISLLFYTLTLANREDASIKKCFDAFSKRMKRQKIGLHGYVWISEVSDNLHWHYHAIIAIDRIKCKGGSLPEFLKMDNIWGARCQVEFIRKNVRYYLANYFTKNKNRINGKRQYGLKMPKK